MALQWNIRLVRRKDADCSVSTLSYAYLIAMAKQFPMEIAELKKAIQMAEEESAKTR